MSRSAPRSLFGVHAATPYSRTTGLPYGELRVMKGSSLSLSSELVELTGGSSKYPWAVEEGAITAELTLNVGQIEDFMIELFLGKAPTALTTEASGNVSTVANKKGTSIVNASNGLSTVVATSADETDLKFGKYALVATAATTADLYLLSSIDRGRGTNVDFLTDAMKIEAIVLTSATHVSAATGLTFTKAGTPVFTVGDTATFEVRPVNSGGMTVRVGGVADQTFPEFGILIYAQKRGNQEMTELDIFRCKAAGMPLPFEMGAFAGFEVKVKCMYDETLDGLFDMRHVKPA